jgi:hypothetical protein
VSERDARLLAQVQAELECRQLPAGTACPRPRINPSRLNVRLLGHRTHGDASTANATETSIWMLDSRVIVKIAHAPNSSRELAHWRNELLVNQYLIPPMLAPPSELQIARPLITRSKDGLVLIVTARLPIADARECGLSTHVHIDAIVRLLAQFHAANWGIKDSQLLGHSPSRLRLGGTLRLDWPSGVHTHRPVSTRLQRAGAAAERWLDERPDLTLLHGDVHQKNFPALQPCGQAAAAAAMPAAGSTANGSAAASVSARSAGALGVGVIDFENAGYGPCLRDFVELVRRTGAGATRAAWVEPLLATYAGALGEALTSRQIRPPSIGELRLQMDVAALEAVHHVAAYEPSEARHAFVPKISKHLAARAFTLLNHLDRGETLASAAEYTAAIVGGRRTRSPHTIEMSRRGVEDLACRTLGLDERCQ